MIMLRTTRRFSDKKLAKSPEKPCRDSEPQLSHHRWEAIWKDRLHVTYYTAVNHNVVCGGAWRNRLSHTKVVGWRGNGCSGQIMQSSRRQIIKAECVCCVLIDSKSDDMKGSGHSGRRKQNAWTTNFQYTTKCGIKAFADPSFTAQQFAIGMWLDKSMFRFALAVLC